MNRRVPLFVLGLILAVAITGFTALYRLRLGQGDVFPAYSSLRADPLGTRALHDSLATLPGMTVTRRFQPIERLETTPPRVLLMAGLSHEKWEKVSPREFAALDAAVRAGSRLVITLRSHDESEDAARKKADGAEEKGTRKKSSPPPDAGDAETPREVPVDLAEQWGVGLKQRLVLGDARRVVGAPETLPRTMTIKSDAYLELAPARPWRVLYRSGGSPVIAEITHGRGSIAIVTDSYFLSNEALQNERQVALLAWVIGSSSWVEFDEGHLGVIENPGVAALARRYGLAGAFFTFLGLAALFVWRQTVQFVPPAAEAPEIMLAYNQTAGLEALLRRAVSPGELTRTCIAEWRRTARAPDIARVEAALVGCAPKASATETYNAVVRALRHR